MELKNRLGYACINLSLKEIKTNRSCTLKTFRNRGLDYISELTLQNIKDLEKIIDWNIKNKIHFFRISSDLIPWCSEIDISKLKHYKIICQILERIGNTAKKHNLRLEFHPSHFCSLSSMNEKTIQTTIRDLENQSLIFDLMGYSPNPDTNLNIHIGTSKPDKITALNRWIENWKKLSQNTRKRIVVENDDKINMFSVKDLYYVYEKTGVPITFDTFHHNFCTGGIEHKEAQILAASTWGEYRPVMHYSSSKKIYEDPLSRETAHADWIYEKIEDWGTNSWVMCESKMKDLSILKYIKEY